MISEKMIAMAKGGSAIRAMFEEGNRMAALYGRENVYDYSLGNPNFPAPKALNDAIHHIIDTESDTVHCYMPNAGYPDVRMAVAENLNKRFGTAFTDANIIMTVGAGGSLNVIFKTILNPGDEVLTIAPYFLEYGNYVRNYDGVLTTVNADPVTFQPDAEAIRAAITPKTKALLVNNPNNPTGVIYTEESVRALAKVLEEKSAEYGHPICLISDEPYRELAYDGAVVPWLTKYYKNTVVCYSWSKSLSLPGERIGYLCIPSECDDFQMLFDAAVVANRILGYVNAPSLMQRAVAKVLDEKTDIDGYNGNRQLLYNGLKDCGFESVYPDGAFYLWMKVPGGDDKAFANAAKKYNLLIVPGSSFACGGYVRLAYCVSPDMIRRSLPAFKKLAEEYGL